MNTYLLWAFNTLFEELLSTAANTANPPSVPFQTLVPSASSSVASQPIGEPCSVTVQKALQSAAAQTGLSPSLLKAVATVESGLNPHVVSSAGAVGLMQLMPETAQSLGVDPNSTADNALGGAEYLKTLLNQFHHNITLALAAYNAGPGAVTQYGGVPPYVQTQQYVHDVLQTYKANG